MQKIFTKVPKTIGVSEFRADLASNLKKAKKQPLIISEKRGAETFILLSQAIYNKLIEAKEDAEDAAELMRLISENKGKKLIPWESIKPK